MAVCENSNKFKMNTYWYEEDLARKKYLTLKVMPHKGDSRFPFSLITDHIKLRLKILLFYNIKNLRTCHLNQYQPGKEEHDTSMSKLMELSSCHFFTCCTSLMG